MFGSRTTRLCFMSPDNSRNSKGPTQVHYSPTSPQKLDVRVMHGIATTQKTNDLSRHRKQEKGWDHTHVLEVTTPPSPEAGSHLSSATPSCGTLSLFHLNCSLLIHDMQMMYPPMGLR